jgi:N-acetylglutamate synthase-like GNAT family acetyltransferase
MERHSNTNERALSSDHGLLRDHLKPGDIGWLIYLHGTFYAQEYGYDQTFETYVAEGLSEFVEKFNPKTDRLWLAERDGAIVGSIAIVGQPKRTAQLRWFFVHPKYRGCGVGKQLLSKALWFCKEKKFKVVSLWTTSELEIAHHLYTNAGFQKTEEITHTIWGKAVVEEHYELRL